MNLKENKVTDWFYHKRIYFYAFLIPAVLMFSVYAAFGCYPFGDNSVLVLDLNGQYVYYYEAMRNAFWGHGSMFYSWSRNLGGEMMGIFAYYLASPFSIIVMLLPKSFILETILIMQLCKLGACGVTFAYYLKKSKRTGDYTTIIFSTLYAMMAYAVVQLMDPMWIDGLIYLPLIIYGTEKLIDEGKKLRFIIPLALMFMANFYIGWMVGFFTFLYFVVYLFFSKKEEDISTKGLISTSIKFGVSTIISIMCAAAILLPVYYSLKLGKLEFTTPDFSLKPQFVLFNFFTKLLPESYDTVRNEGLPFVYCGTLTLFMIPLYFTNNNIEMRKKVGNGVLLTSVLLSMYLSTVDIAWHGFQVPNWLPYRYSFVFSFVMLVMAAEAFERIEGVSYKQLGATFAGLLLYVLYVDTQKFKYLETTQGIWFSLICIVGFAMLLYHYKRHYNVKSIPLIILVLVVGELFGGSLQTLESVNKDVVYSKHSSYENYIQDGREIIDAIEKKDNSFYRTEKTFYRTVNDPLAYGMKGITHSSSTLNAGPINFLYNLGYTSGGHYVKYKGDTLLTDAILGIKYVITKDKYVHYDTSILSQDGMTVYQNPNALSVGYMVNKSIKDLKIEHNNPFVNQNKLLSAMVSDKYVEYFKPITVNDTKFENVQSTPSGIDTKYTPIVKGQNAHIEFLMDVPTDDLIYMYLPSSYVVGRQMNIWVNKNFLDYYYETDDYCIKTLGKFNSGESLSVIATIVKDEAYMKDQWFYYLDQKKFEEDISKLKQGQLNVTKYSDTYIEGNVTAADGQVLFTTIPYEPGWTIKVDGKKVEPIKLADALIGIDVPAGQHQITMSFFPKGLKLGLIISFIGILLVVVVAILEKKNRNILLKRLYN